MSIENDMALGELIGKADLCAFSLRKAIRELMSMNKSLRDAIISCNEFFDANGEFSEDGDSWRCVSLAKSATLEVDNVMQKLMEIDVSQDLLDKASESAKDALMGRA